jgi:hypothetical protein
MITYVTHYVGYDELMWILSALRGELNARVTEGQ